MTKYFDETNKIRRQPPNSDKVIINTEEYEGDPVREWICPWCNLILHARKSAKSAFCIRCQMDIDISTGKAQELQTIEDPNKDRDSEPCVTSIQTDFAGQVAIKKEPELKSGFKALRDKELRITNYTEHNP